MNTDEIVRALRQAANAKTEVSLTAVIMYYAADLIESLEAQLTDEKITSQSLRNAANGYKTELAEAQKDYDILDAACIALHGALDAAERRERAAVEDIRRICDKCYMGRRQWLSDGKMDAVCRTCLDNNRCNWQWRGPQEEKENEA